MMRPFLSKRKRQRRQLRFERLEDRIVFNGQPVLANDSYTLRENGPQTTLDVLANDLFGAEYPGSRRITSVSFGSEGGRIEIAADGQSVLYTPPADYFGAETFVYAVDGQFTAQVQVRIDSPLVSDRFMITPDGQERILDVLANDPFWDGYDRPRKITAVSVGSEGGIIQIAADGKSILYTPPDEAFGKETFTYVVDEIYPAHVTIEIPQTLKPDRYDLAQHSPPTNLYVLANDPFWTGYSGARRITQVMSENGGQVEIAGDGHSIIYTPTAGMVGGDSLRYVVDSAYESSVWVVIHRPVQNDSFEVDHNSSEFYYNVTANDRFGGPNNNSYDVIDRVTSVTQPQSGGIVTISADGQGIVYTPAAGFTGTDSFTYTADGLHVAHVYVRVTLPVRDDVFKRDVYQDTTGTLDVLANDFLGNGYTGPSVITGVGPTENGGTVTVSSDGKAILYTPALGYTGEDRFTYIVDGVLEANVTLHVTPLAQPDHVTLYPNPRYRSYSIEVLGNDHFNKGYAGPGVITAAELEYGSGQVTIQSNGTLLLNPTMAGGYTIRYTVDGKYQATAYVSILGVVFPDTRVLDQNSPVTQIDVLSNDFRTYHYNYVGPSLITGITQSQHGGVVTIAADGKSVYYQPPTDFYGQDSFTYTVDNFMTTTVTGEVIRRVRDDQFRVDHADGTQALPVLVNDLFGANYAGPGQITAVSATSSGGAAAIGADGRTILYTPAAGFTGTETFTYTVDGRLKAQVRVVVDAPPSQQFPAFASLEAYTQFLLDDALARYQYLFGQTVWNGYPWVHTTNDVDATLTRNHSETNVQVAGVDEGDIIEFDSDYLYMLTEGDLVIVDAWPGEELSIASRFDIEGRPIAQFLHGDRLTIISEVSGGFLYPTMPYDDTAPIVGDVWRPYPVLPSSTVVTVLDVSNRTAPTLVQRTEMEGKFVDSRSVEGMVYVLVSNANAVAQKPQVIDTDNDPSTPGRYETREEFVARVAANQGAFVEEALPNYTTYGANGETVRAGLLNLPENVYQPLVAGATNLTSIVSFDSHGNSPGLVDTSGVYSTGASTIYASLDNFYVFDADWSREDGAVTRIVKFDWEPSSGDVEFIGTTTVAGTILNQFSADEHNGFLRIATTVSNYHAGNWSDRAENMLFVLREDGGVFEYVGSLQNLALDETMRSVRFLGERAFVTTFRTIDPLFAIDLSDPANPVSVGHITLPGFTSYMHLVDANHLLTVGRNSPPSSVGPTQVSLFDISDLLHPRRIAEYTFERFSTSEAELDHHAFGYYAEHGLLAMPVSRQYVIRVDADGDGYRETRQWVVENQLAVFSIDVDALSPGGRLALAGEINHASPVRRSGYIGDKLFSIAGDSVKVVNVSAPGQVIAELAIAPPADSLVSIEPVFEFTSLRELLYLPAQPVPLPNPVNPRLALVERARLDLARRLNLAAGSPLLVTYEATPKAGDLGVSAVFRVGERQYLYRVRENGPPQLVDADYRFSPSAGAWNAIATTDRRGQGRPQSRPEYKSLPPRVPVDRPPSRKAWDKALRQLPANVKPAIETMLAALDLPPAASKPQTEEAARTSKSKASPRDIEAKDLALELDVGRLPAGAFKAHATSVPRLRSPAS